MTNIGQVVFSICHPATGNGTTEDPIMAFCLALEVVLVLPAILLRIDNVLSENDAEVLFRKCYP